MIIPAGRFSIWSTSGMMYFTSGKNLCSVLAVVIRILFWMDVPVLAGIAGPDGPFGDFIWLNAVHFGNLNCTIIVHGLYIGDMSQIPLAGLEDCAFSRFCIDRIAVFLRSFCPMFCVTPVFFDHVPICFYLFENIMGALAFVISVVFHRVG